MVDQLARGLFAAGHEVLLAAPADSTCPVPKVPRLLESPPPRMGQTVVELRYVIAAYAALRDVDVVHDHTTLGPLSVPGRGDTPVPATNHGPFDEELRPISAEMSRRGIGVVAISRHQASTGRGVRIAGVIHHGINVSAIRVGPGDGGYACFLGRMLPGKGVRQAVLAAREVGVPLWSPRRCASRSRRSTTSVPSGRHWVVRSSTSVSWDQRTSTACSAARWPWSTRAALAGALRPGQIEALSPGTPVIVSPKGSVPEIVTDAVTGFVRSGTTDIAKALIEVPALQRAACRAAAEASSPRSAWSPTM